MGCGASRGATAVGVEDPPAPFMVVNSANSNTNKNGEISPTSSSSSSSFQSSSSMPGSGAGAGGTTTSPPPPAPVSAASVYAFLNPGKNLFSSSFRNNPNINGGSSRAIGAGAGGGGGGGGGLLGRFSSNRDINNNSNNNNNKNKNTSSSSSGGTGSGIFRFYAIQDKYETLEDVTEGLRAAGLESSNLLIAIDYTKSNTWTGRNSFQGRSLHWIDPTSREPNPYMMAITAIGKALASYDDDNLLPVWGFGDSTTTDKSVFPFFPDRPARGFEEVLARYKELTPRVILGGPTNFAPAIEAAIQVVQKTRAYHILLLIADGQVTNRAHTEAAIVRASEYPLSIVLVGVGDHPDGDAETFDDQLPQRKFDNFQFVNFTKIVESYPSNPEVAFALAALMEIPEQYMAIRQLGYI